eukprot:scaffold24837_cov105-Isochrysis_galbana.AAC.3
MFCDVQRCLKVLSGARHQPSSEGMGLSPAATQKPGRKRRRRRRTFLSPLQGSRLLAASGQRGSGRGRGGGHGCGGGGRAGRRRGASNSSAPAAAPADSSDGQGEGEGEGEEQEEEVVRQPASGKRCSGRGRGGGSGRCGGGVCVGGRGAGNSRRAPPPGDSSPDEAEDLLQLLASKQPARGGRGGGRGGRASGDSAGHPVTITTLPAALPLPFSIISPSAPCPAEVLS